MPVERNTPQLVKKGKGKKRPGYRGPGGYQGGRSSSTSSGKSGNTGTSNRPNPHTSSGTSKTTTVSGNRMRSSAKETQQAINNARAIEDAKKAKRKENLKNTTKFGYAKPKSKFGGILGTIAGMMLGIPGLGLLTGGLGSLGSKLGDVFGNFNETMRGINPVTGKVNTQKEYEKMVADRRTQGRIDNMTNRMLSGKNFSQKNLDSLMGQTDRFGNQFGPSTAQNVLSGRDLKGFTDSRMGLQTMTPNNLMAGLTAKQQQMLSGPQKNMRDIMGISNQEILDNISPFNDPEDPATLEEVQTFYGADGGIASMFTRRG